MCIHAIPRPAGASEGKRGYVIHQSYTAAFSNFPIYSGEEEYETTLSSTCILLLDTHPPAQLTTRTASSNTFVPVYILTRTPLLLLFRFFLQVPKSNMVVVPEYTTYSLKVFRVTTSTPPTQKNDQILLQPQPTVNIQKKGGKRVTQRISNLYLRTRVNPSPLLICSNVEIKNGAMGRDASG